MEQSELSSVVEHGSAFMTYSFLSTGTRVHISEHVLMLWDVWSLLSTVSRNETAEMAEKTWL